jgi:NAD(P)-dependent dehydrogenase (short-subunit alcohol dehydrogenase family)
MAPSPIFDLAGKVALIIGGSRNQGAAIAENIASRGAVTVISYASDDESAEQTLEKLEKYGGTAEAIRSDAAASADVSVLFEGVVARHSTLDVVVHVPGAVLKKPLADSTDAEFDHLINLNTRSAFNTLRHSPPHRRPWPVRGLVHHPRLDHDGPLRPLLSLQGRRRAHGPGRRQGTRRPRHHRQRGRSRPGRRLLLPCRRDP